MSDNNAASLLWTVVQSQPVDVRELPSSERDAIIINAIQVEGHWVILSRYADDHWQLDGMPTICPDYRRRLDFQRVPAPFRSAMKAVVYRYLRRGRAGQRRPKGATLNSFFDSTLAFLRHLHALKITTFGEVTPIIFTNYAAECKDIRQIKGKPLSQSSLLCRLKSVEALYELSQHTHDPLPMQPWPGTSSKAMAGLTGSGSPHKQRDKTPLIPDAVFCTLFEKAYQQVLQGKTLLDLRDALHDVETELKGASYDQIRFKKKCCLIALGWEEGLESFSHSLISLRTACYVVIASTSGCRNHELGNIQSGSHHRTEDDENLIFHWMRSKSEKTDAGVRDWMVPEAAVRALRLMARWAQPYQAMIADEIAVRRRINPLDPEIAQAQKHRHALFLGMDSKKGNQIRTLSTSFWNISLKAFAKSAGLNWSIASHQFRRKFANYVAHSRFGDLRYLREHFAHWSMDMALSYAMDERWGNHLDLELYDDIEAELEDIKLGTVEGWLGNDSLAGGYGRSLKRWQRNPANLAIFKDHQTMMVSIAESTAIRSNGHAWCTADNHGCVGNTLERTRCGDCINAVISPDHLGIYRQLYSNLKELLECRDIGDIGQVRVLRDLARCRDVFMQLGYDPESNTA
ncbi:integrase [Pseudomonas fluorescens]|uniref:Integrase n=1 Tax=Pseudomonas fluorescens TaxID=294 RepID=A0A5E7FN22_PSEFL|nr:integrase [Pseudomonas fluorescens]VVO40615.1 hypothetical protein PS833_05786 [Pseudomonas fluorescens]